MKNKGVCQRSISAQSRRGGNESFRVYDPEHGRPGDCGNFRKPQSAAAVFRPPADSPGRLGGSAGSGRAPEAIRLRDRRGRFAPRDNRILHGGSIMKEKKRADCGLKAYYDRKTQSLLGRIWNRHIAWCPGWKAYLGCLPPEKKQEIMNKYRCAR